ncbi:MAG TPA: hypothetical protein VGD98_06385 [Ktedonobacteraceae bacterium]
MNLESTSKIQRTQSSKPASYKRAHRANRPVLVTSQNTVASATEPALDLVEPTSDAPVALEEKVSSEAETVRRRGPRFFSSVGKAEMVSDQPKTDPIAARLTRALRGKGVENTPAKETVKEKKTASVASTPATSAAVRPKSGFKMKYIWGMMSYLLIADFLGVWIQNWMKAQGVDGLVFTLGAFQASRSTLVFLALLIVILVLMARFDLIPRSFGAALGGPSSQRKDGPNSSSRQATFDTREPQPTIKQGIKGSNDELYREYRENQRYFQKRDRKR